MAEEIAMACRARGGLGMGTAHDKHNDYFENMKNMKKTAFFLAAATLFLTACEPADTRLSPENLSDVNWKNGVWVMKDGRSGFFVTAEAEKLNLAPGAKLSFAKSGERVVTQVQVAPPYVNVFVDGPLDPEGDGYPNKVSR
jgi:hypothetical protein